MQDELIYSMPARAAMLPCCHRLIGHAASKVTWVLQSGGGAARDPECSKHSAQQVSPQGRGGAGDFLARGRLPKTTQWLLAVGVQLKARWEFSYTMYIVCQGSEF